MSNAVEKTPALAITLSLAIALLPAAQAYALGASTGVVRGYVKSAATSAAISAAKVRVFDMITAESVAETARDDEGAVALPARPFGFYEITASGSGGYVSGAGSLLSLTEDDPEATVSFDLEFPPNAPRRPAAGRVSFLGLSGGRAIAALIGVLAAAGLATYGIVRATEYDSP